MDKIIEWILSNTKTPNKDEGFGYGNSYGNSESDGYGDGLSPGCGIFDGRGYGIGIGKSVNYPESGYGYGFASNDCYCLRNYNL